MNKLGSIDTEAIVQRQRKDFIRSLKLMKVCLQSNESKESLSYDILQSVGFIDFGCHRIRMLFFCRYCSLMIAKLVIAGVFNLKAASKNDF